MDSFTPDRVCQDILTIADTEHADRFAWFGFSFGAVVGLQLAVRTDRLTGLVLGGWPPLGVFRRCTVLVCVAGFGSGFIVRSVSRRCAHILLFIFSVLFYWIGFSVVSSPYSPIVWLYQMIGFGLVRGALISFQLSIANLVILTLAIWVGAVCGYSPSIAFNESGSLYE